MKKYLLISFFYVGAISMLVMSMHFFQHQVSGIMKYKDVSESLVFRFAFKTHIFFGIVAIFTGPIQFLTNSNHKLLSIHRNLGYVYLGSVLTSSVMGLGIAPFAMGGMISTVGFSSLAIFWFSSAFAAIRAIKQGRIMDHKMWMYVSYGLTFGAIPQRTLLLLPMIVNVEFITIYRLSAWLPWILNSAIAFYLFQRSKTNELQSAITN